MHTHAAEIQRSNRPVIVVASILLIALGWGWPAVLKAGGAYVPLDPDHPAERIAHILDTAQPACVLSTTADAVPVPEGTDVAVGTLLGRIGDGVRRGGPVQWPEV